MGSCNDFCDVKKEVYKDPLQLLNEKKGEISVTCQICQERMSNREYQQHLDFCHFSAIADNKKESMVLCLICGFSSLTLKGLERHTKIKHHYLEEQKAENLRKYKEKSAIVNYRTIRNKMKEVEQNDINLVPKSENHYTATFNFQTFDAIVHEKQYKSIEYNRDLVKGDLIYRYAFTSCPSSKYYSISAEEGEKGILCKGILLMQAD